MSVKADNRRLIAAIIGLVLLTVPNVVADDVFVEQLLPPDKLRADYHGENHTMILEWNPPTSDADSPFTYRVYRNAVMIGETGNTWYEANLTGSLHVFYVTAWLNGNESAPSQPAIAHQSSGARGSPGAVIGDAQIIEGSLGPRCEILIIVTYTQWPFVGYTLQEWCVPVAGSLLSAKDPAEMTLG